MYVQFAVTDCKWHVYWKYQTFSSAQQYANDATVSSQIQRWVYGSPNYVCFRKFNDAL